MLFAFRACVERTPDVFFDTTGCAFTFFVARVLAGCKVVAYVHYPTISSDMLHLVWDRRPTYNNDVAVTRSTIITYFKLVYYIIFALAYASMGSLCHVVMVNSSWTRGHISLLWKGAAGRIWTVFPPCDVDQSYKTMKTSFSLSRPQPIILSIGQFRPEKDHKLQIYSFAKLLEKYPKWKAAGAKLVLLGSCRGEDDKRRVKELSFLVKSMELNDSVQFVLNQPYSVLKDWCNQAAVGLHTMWNEHFGIAVVEMMAAGLLVIAHNSGGPKEDIIVTLPGTERTGFLALTKDEFADSMNAALSMSKEEATRTRQRAIDSVNRFSDDTFGLSFKRVILDSKILT
mmetsp:Transcript_13411/g.15390  ORF Transcript_13411/g.15390 Transcript_13411/m.15390 type:complete len:342 (+) Transcript_13411:548-1573(+)